MKYLSLLLILLFVSTGLTLVNAQNVVAYNEARLPDEAVLPMNPTKVAAPVFRGPEGALNAYIKENITYPERAIKDDIEGIVIVEFYINTDGSLEDIQIVESVSAVLDQEVIRLVKSMPAWQPAYHNGMPYRVKYRMPVAFNLSF